MCQNHKLQTVFALFFGLFFIRFLLTIVQTLYGSSVRFSFLGRRADTRDDSAEIVFQTFYAGFPCQQFCHGQGHPLFDVVQPALALPTTTSPTLQCALKDGVGEVIVACDMPEPCKFQSFDSCRKRFLGTEEEVDPAPHPVVGLVLQVGDSEKNTAVFRMLCLSLGAFSCVIAV